MYDKLIEIAHKLGVAHASGVDTEDALEHLKDLACNFDWDEAEAEDAGDGEDDE